MESFTRQLRSLTIRNRDFSQQLKLRLVHESSNVKNPLSFIAALFNEGVLSDKFSAQDSSFGLSVIIVQLVMMITCSKGSDAMDSLMKALEASGNLELISALRAWIQEDFTSETGGQLRSSGTGNVPVAQSATNLIDTMVSFVKDQLSGKSEAGHNFGGEAKGADSTAQTKNQQVLAKQKNNSNETSSCGAKLVDNIMSRVEDHFMGQLEGLLVSKATEIVNIPEFYSSLVHQKATGSAVRVGKQIEKVVKAVCSKKMIGSLVIAFQSSSNERILAETCKWLEALPVRKLNDPFSFQCLARQPSCTKKSNSLQVGDRIVWAREETGKNEAGLVKWLGLIQGEQIAGIQFDSPLYLGSGWYENKRLFPCPRHHGGLVAVAALMLEQDFVSISDVGQPLVSLARLPRATATGIFAATEKGLISLDSRTLKVTALTSEETLAVAVNHSLKKVYWSEGWPKSHISRSNFDGSAKQIIVPQTGDRIRALAIDTASGNVYFALIDSHEIEVCNALGDNCAVLISNSSLVNDVVDIALDSSNGFIYWGNRGSGSHSVVRANLDGSNSTIISTGFKKLAGITLDQPPNGVLYLADAGACTIGTIDVNDGKKRTLVELDRSSGPWGIQVDEAKIYFSPDWCKTIQSVDKNSGKGLTTIFESTGYVHHLALFNAPVTQP